MKARIYLLVCLVIFVSHSIEASDVVSFLKEKFALRDEELFAIHSTLFDTFNPLMATEIDAAAQRAIDKAKEQSFFTILGSDTLRQSVSLFKNLNLLHNKLFLRAYYLQLGAYHDDKAAISSRAVKPIKKFLHHAKSDSHHASLENIDVDNRHKLFSLLINSPINVLRQIGFYTKLFYTNAFYQSELSEYISNIPAHHPPEKSVVTLPSFKTHLQYNEHKKEIEGHLDVIIVGSGAAGSIAAYEFQKRGLKVLVVEAGSFVMPGAFDTTSDMRFMESQNPRLSEDGSIAFLNGESVGGGTTINLDMAFSPTLPMVRHRFHQWHEKGLIPHDVWTDDEIDDAYRKVFTIFAPRVIEWDEINENNNVLMQGASRLGFGYQPYQLNHYEKGKSPHKVSNKKSSTDLLLIPAMTESENPLSLLSDCRVNKVLIKNKKAYGVECTYEPRQKGFGIIRDPYGFTIRHKSTIKIYANSIVLAAGNLGTSSVLLRSDVDNKNIGRGFVAHPFISLKGEFDSVIRADLGEPSTIYVDHFMPTDKEPNNPGFMMEAAIGRINLWALLNPGIPAQARADFENISHAAGFSVMLSDTAHDDNYVELGRDGQIKVHYRLTDFDKLRLISGVKTSAKILFAAGARNVSFNSYEAPMYKPNHFLASKLTPDMDMDEAFENFRLERNMTSILGAHMMGGNKMGFSTQNAVVNKNYQVFGVNDLFVIDSSVFPGSVGANPMQTIYTSAEIFVTRFLRNMAFETFSKYGSQK